MKFIQKFNKKTFFKKDHIMLFLSLILFGCENKEKRYALKTVSVISKKHMNNNSVVRLDIIQVLDQSLWDTISQMNSNQYFETRKSILTNNSQNLRIWSFEPLPTMKLDSFCITNWAPICYGVVGFMSYQNDQDNKFVLSPKTKHLTVKLGEDGLDKTISANNAPKNLKNKTTIGVENEF